MKQSHHPFQLSSSFKLSILVGLFVAILYGLLPSNVVSSSSVSTASVGYLPLVTSPLVFEATPLSGSFSVVTDIVNAGDDRLFITQQRGVIMVQQSDGTASTFLDISSKVRIENWEQGLLGIAFHPDYATNGYFYIVYTAHPHESGTASSLTISRFKVSADPNVASPTEEIMWRTPRDGQIHNGGSLRFAPDGYLYLGIGDDFQFDNAQVTTNVKGKIVRFSPESIVRVNRSVTANFASPQIWAMGVRNPWRIAFDPANGNMFIGDVGKDRFEEINALAADVRFQNLGWPCKEGTDVLRDDSFMCGSVYIDPLYQYVTHENGRCSIILGDVFREQNVLNVLYGDFCTGEVWILSYDGSWQNELLGVVPRMISTFGRGADGTYYVGTFDDGPLYRLTIP